VILACTVLIQITSVTDRQTPRRWLRRTKHSAVARKKLWVATKLGGGLCPRPGPKTATVSRSLARNHRLRLSGWPCRQTDGRTHARRMTIINILSHRVKWLSLWQTVWPEVNCFRRRRPGEVCGLARFKSAVPLVVPQYHYDLLGNVNSRRFGGSEYTNRQSAHRFLVAAAELRPG